ncbi:MAG: M20 family metallopeptidase [Methylacidiphilales bacterium]|nr:M20 family metallopeptidase [Candidatus Methylacidiphilales bacterium]MDW8350061.1 M20 family metallopeptidase [Verrucomicrobiae bacterium]
MNKNPRDVTELLCELIQIPSVNPTGTPGTEGVNEDSIAHYLADYLKRIGADEVELMPVYPHRPNVRARFLGGRAQTSNGHVERIAFAPHTDTVSVLGMTIEPFKPRVADGRIYGRGSTDTKGPMAAMLWALKTWASSPQRAQSQNEVYFLGLMGEEAGNEGAQAIARDGSVPLDFVLVGEPTEFRVVYAHKGAIWIEVETRGKACHASTPDRGKNAINEMARFLVWFQSAFPKFLAKFKSSTLGSPTFNIGTISGGSKVNIVPDRCRIEIDCRSVPGLTHTAVLRFIQKQARQEGWTIRTRLIGYRPPMEVSPQNPWVQKLARVSRGLQTAPWFCDAAIFAQRGIPAVAFGPGSIRQAHTVDEFIRQKDLEEGVKRYERFLANV